ncbi:MAG TPA: peptidoglycan DD-metalloendopeptidase family protein [Kamptonema sp.]|nr:peptidoglycan DD-metalloendopeptidase family protein [Kamptonema sp.]
MKRTFPDKLNFVDAREINIDGTVEPSKQANAGTGRVRSAAMIGLAISVGAGILLPRGGEGATAAELVAPEATNEMQPMPIAVQSNPLNIEDETAHAATATFNPTVVKVEKGQTLWELSQNYEVDPNTLANANGIKSDSLLQVGQQLKIPSLGAIALDTKTGNNVATLPSQTRYVDTEQEFKSNQGEQFGKHSREATLSEGVNDNYQQTRDSAINNRWNQQESGSTANDRSQLGLQESANSSESELAVPTQPTEAATIAPASVSETTTASQVLPAVPTDKFDALNSGTQPGVTLAPAEVTPNVTGTVVIEPNVTAPAASSVLYNVRSGDTLDAIAERYGISVAELISANDISDPHYLKLNQALKIPQIGQNSSREQAATVLSDSNSKAAVVVGETAIPLIPDRSAIAPNSGVAVPAPTVSVISSLSNTEVTSSVSVPTVAKINSIPLTPFSTAGVTDRGRSALNAQSKFTGTFGQSPLPSDAQGVTEALAPIGSRLTSPARELGADKTIIMPTPTREIASTDEMVTVDLQASKAAHPSNPYADRLRSEISRLREEYRADRNNQQEPRAISGTAFASNTQQNAVANHSNRMEPINPEFSPHRYAQAVQHEISTPQSREWAQQFQRQQQQERANAERAARRVPTQTPAKASEQPLVATAPLGADAYDPLNNPSLGRMVSPELPPLPAADTYLPAGSMRSKGFIWPAKGVLSSGYGWRWGRMHKGIDIASDIGTPIVAADAGVVTYAAWNDGGYGYLVEITHANGTQTLYGHNSRILVQEGQRVAQGQQISEMGSTGFSTGPHLHFEIHPSGQGAVNPMAFLPQNDSRSASE